MLVAVRDGVNWAGIQFFTITIATSLCVEIHSTVEVNKAGLLGVRVLSPTGVALTGLSATQRPRQGGGTMRICLALSRLGCCATHLTVVCATDSEVGV